MREALNQLDHHGTAVIQSLPAWLHPVMLAATFAGLPAVLVAMAIVGALAAWQSHRQQIAWALVASMLALGGNSLLKLALRRVRPDTIYANTMQFKTFSFPSGHAFGSVAFYGLLAYLATKYLPAPWSWIAAALLVVLIVAIGLSRVYLGAHYPTDVLGGWILGGFALALIITLIHP
jgi:undecaprenyl-diphosphatase